MKTHIKVGQRFYSNLGNAPWTVKAIDGKHVTLVQSGKVKNILTTSLIYTYTLIGSKLDSELRESYQRHGWPIHANNEVETPI